LRNNIKYIFRIHAVRRMFQRGIDETEVKDIVEQGETIEEYPDDSPFPSRLVLGWSENRPLHIVVADNQKSAERIIVTVYEPNPDQWDNEFKRRKQ
jgi:hypothetical protein